MRYRSILPAFLVLGLAASAGAATLTVDLNGGADYTDIQSAIDAAADGDTVLVKPGEYVIRRPVMFMGKAIALSGEEGAASTVIRMSDSPADRDIASVVLFEDADTAASVLEGFTLTGGTGTYRYGGGVHGGGSAIIRRCTIKGNSAWQGGGVHCGGEGSALRLIECTITENEAQYGAGISCAACSGICPAFMNCSITGNVAKKPLGGHGGSGGGVYCEVSSPTLVQCIIVGNTAEHSGGGVYLHFARASFQDCRVGWNRAEYDGGGIWGWGHGSLFDRCFIVGNSAGRGGGILMKECSSTLTNCAVSGNFAEWAGGVYAMSSSCLLMNCTLTENIAAAVFGAIECFDSRSTIENCIVWDNEPQWTVPSEFCEEDVSYSCIQGSSAWPGEGNINLDPLLARKGDWSVDADGQPLWREGDMHLTAASPCIDAGWTRGAPTLDMEGHGRPCGAWVDIGAYEFGQCPANFPEFKRGDANSDTEVNVADAVQTLSYLFRAAAATCLDAVDANDSGEIDIADPIKLLSHLFAHTGPLPAPFGTCGIDPTIDNLDCASYAHCAAR